MYMVNKFDTSSVSHMFKGLFTGCDIGGAPKGGGGGLVLCVMCKIHLLAMCYVGVCSHCYVKLK